MRRGSRIAFALLILLPALARADLVFVDRAAESGLAAVRVHGSIWYGAAVAFVDLDGDGWPDLYFGAGPGEPDILCTNLRNGRFDCAPGSGPPNLNAVLALAAGDFDSDGDLDLYVMRDGPNSLYRNDGAGHFTDVTAETRTAGDPSLPITATGSFLDFNQDGRLDLYLGHWQKSSVTPGARDQVLVQGADGRFSDVASAIGIDDHNRSSLAIAAVDYDQDQWPDLLVTGDFSDMLLFHNTGGRFEDVTAAQPPGFAQAVTEGMGIDSADLDGDGWVDLYLTGNKQTAPGGLKPGETGAALLMGGPDGTFTSRGADLGVNAGYAWGTGIADFDNDGWLDIFVATDMAPNHSVFRNLRGQAFAETALPGIRFGTNQCVTAAFADYDGDGRVDVVLHRITNQEPQLFHNETSPSGHWLEVSTRPPAPPGTRISVTTGLGAQARQVLSQASRGSQSDVRLTFGLGDASLADVEIRVPGRAPLVLSAVPADQWLVVDDQGRLLKPTPAAGCSLSAGPLPSTGSLLLIALIGLCCRVRRSRAHCTM